MQPKSPAGLAPSPAAPLQRCEPPLCHMQLSVSDRDCEGDTTGWPGVTHLTFIDQPTILKVMLLTACHFSQEAAAWIRAHNMTVPDRL